MEGKRGMGAQRSGVPCLKSPSKSIAGVGIWEYGCTFILAFSSLSFRTIMTVVIQHERGWHSPCHSGCDACVFSFPSPHSLHSLHDLCCSKFDILDRVMQANCVISGIAECLGSDWSVHLLWAGPAHPSHTYMPGSPSPVCGICCLCAYVTAGKRSCQSCELGVIVTRGEWLHLCYCRGEPHIAEVRSRVRRISMICSKRRNRWRSPSRKL